MLPRTVAAALVLAATLAVTACQPEPEPTPTGPAFASEDEAFAAAEQTYRAYVDALNARREDPTSTPDPQTFLVGDALEVDVETQQQLDQAGLRVVGNTEIAALVGTVVEGDQVEIEVCLDSSGTRVENVNGADVTPPDRELRSLALVGLTMSSGDPLISSSTTKEAEGC